MSKCYLLIEEWGHGKDSHFEVKCVYLDYSIANDRLNKLKSSPTFKDQIWECRYKLKTCRLNTRKEV